MHAPHSKSESMLRLDESLQGRPAPTEQLMEGRQWEALDWGHLPNGNDI